MKKNIFILFVLVFSQQLMAQIWYLDYDGDTYGASEDFGDYYSGGNPWWVTAATQPAGYVSNNLDCFDGDPNVNIVRNWYADLDADGCGNPNSFIFGCFPINGAVANNLDCNDNNPLDAIFWYPDIDGDGYGSSIGNSLKSCVQPKGYAVNQSDCDDTDANKNPAAIWYLDTDGDRLGSGSPFPGCNPPGNNYVTNNVDQCPTVAGDGTINGCPYQPATLSNGLSDDNYVYIQTPQKPVDDILQITDVPHLKNIAYYDGLGRPRQNIAIGAGGQNQDIINAFVYDEYGRQTKEFLPFTNTASQGGKMEVSPLISISNFYNIPKYENTDNPYSQKGFEPSPLNRVLKQAAPGNDWKLGNGHEIKLDYQNNTANEVKNLGVSLVLANKTYVPTLVDTGFYNTNELYKTITFDENTAAAPTELNGSTVEFKNKQGQVVLKRTYGTVGNGITNEKHDTYYVYDDFGNLTFVIPPKAADIVFSGTTIQSNVSSTAVVSTGNNLNLTASNSITLQSPFYAQSGSTFTATIVSGGNSALDELCYQYKYDQRNRLVEKKLPGKQWEFILYDKLDRVVATGPALSPFNDTGIGVVGWLITKYDVFSRPVYTGWEQSTTVNSAGRILKQNALNSATTFNESKQASKTIDGITAYYTNTIVPLSFKLLTVNYYDDYAYPNMPGIPATVENQTVLATTEVKGLATGSWTRIPTTSSSIVGETTTTFYDKKARPIGVYAQNFLGGYTQVDSKLDFTGKPDYLITYHKRDSNSNSTVLKTKDVFTYSTQGRLLVQTHQINDGTVETIAENSYDELGQLTSKAVGGNTQKVDYTYNIRGWLKGINNAGALQQSGDPIDLFAFAINYNTPSANISGVNALYNGNIAETQWATNSDGVLRTYGYKYDNLNRLTQGIYKKANIVTNAYDEGMDYDKNGNIMHLTRFASLNDGAQTQIDNLTYDYKNSNASNQLMKVSDVISNNPGFKDEFKDSASNATDDYTYDANGNMIKDNNKNITGITYNQLNLPTKITFATTGNIVYIYNAAGQKVQKVVNRTGLNAETTDYLGGYQYNNAANVTNPSLKFFPTAEGYVEPSGSSYKYVYQYKDHLGNVRLSYDKSLNIQEESNYYPFGLKQTGYGNNVIVNSDYKYRYQSQEFQDELGLNIYFFKFRMSDPAIGRFLQIDPLSPTYAHNSTYAFAENNVTSGTDLEGLELSFNLQGDRATAQSGPRVTGGVNGNYTLQELRSHMAQKQAEYDRAMSKILPSDPRALPKADIHLPPSDIRVARFNDPGMMMADGARIGAEIMATDIAVGKIFQGIGALRKGESVWALNALQRGRKIEQMLGADASWASNFPTIDKIVDGVATSIKSMDLTATSYQKGNSVLNTLKGYVDDLAGFSNKTWGSTVVRQGQEYTSKALELAVQTGKGTESQWNQINQAINYALEKDINVTIRFIK